MRRSLLVTVTNYLGSTQFYLTRTHQKIGHRDGIAAQGHDDYSQLELTSVLLEPIEV